MLSICIKKHKLLTKGLLLYPCKTPWLWLASLALLSSQATVAGTSSMEYYHYNHQGSLLEVYDGTTNKRLLSQAWSPWGERQVLHAAAPSDTRTSASSISNLIARGLPVRMGYTGHKELLATGLTFAGDTRLYDARLKRFLNSDDRTTGGISGQNRYSYAYNNPMAYIDPDGHAPLSSFRELRRKWQVLGLAAAYAPSTSTVFAALSVVREYMYLAEREQVARKVVKRIFKNSHRYDMLMYKRNLERVGVLPQMITEFENRFSIDEIKRIDERAGQGILPKSLLLQLHINNAVKAYKDAKYFLGEHKMFVDQLAEIHRVAGVDLRLTDASRQNYFRHALTEYYMKQMTLRGLYRQDPVVAGKAMLEYLRSPFEDKELSPYVFNNLHPFTEDELSGIEVGYSVKGPYPIPRPHRPSPSHKAFYNPDHTLIINFPEVYPDIL